MDPTLAALLGAGLGLTGTVLAPLVTSRRAHKARRREIMRDAYAEGMRCVSDIPRAKAVEDYESMKERLFAAQIQIRLVGSRKAGRRYDELCVIVDDFMAKVQGEAVKFRPLTRAQTRVARTFPEERRTALGVAHQAFILVARRDIGMEDAWWQRTTRFFVRRFEQRRKGRPESA